MAELVFASFDLSSDSFDVEQLSMTPDPTRETEQLHCVRLRDKGVLALRPSGAHIRHVTGNESAGVDIATIDDASVSHPTT